MYFQDVTNIEATLYATLFFIARYLLIAGLLYAVFYRLWKTRFLENKIQKKWPNLAQIRLEIGYSLLTFAIFGSAVWLFMIWNRAGITLRYTEIDTFGRLYFIFSIGLMVVLHDAYFYWTHRLMHHRWVFPYVHRVHHGFHNPTPWAAFALHPLETILSLGIIPIIVFCIPYHPLALMCFITFMTLYSVLIHLGYRVKALSLIAVQNTTEDHDYHHRKGHGNYGLYFTVWDKLMGTYVSTRN